MRINIYSQELTKEVELVETIARDTGRKYYGIRLYLHSPSLLHHTPEDDDRSAVTFWIPHNKTFSRRDLINVFEAMAGRTREAPDPSDTH